LMPNPTRPPGLIQRYGEELQARHYARRTVATYEQWWRGWMGWRPCVATTGP
jgi:hypothetical protein